MSIKNLPFDPRTKQMDDTAAFCLATAAKLGCQAVQVTTTTAQEKSLVVESGSFTLANSVISDELTLVVHKDAKKGSIKTNSFDHKYLALAVQDAVSLARFSVADPYLAFATSSVAPKAKPLKFLCNKDVAALDFEALKETLTAMLAVTQKNPQVAMDRMEIAVESSHHRLYNSHGVMQDESTAGVTWSLSGMAREDDDVAGFDYDGGFSFDAARYHEQALTETGRFVDRILANLNPRKCPSYHGPVILSPRAFEELLLDIWLYHATGYQIMDGKSRWQDSLEKPVVSSLITLRDDPFDATLEGAASFDNDGVPTVPCTLIEEGKLKMHLHDCYSAKRFGTISNGMSGGPFALHLEPGKDTLDSMLQARSSILYVDRFSGNTDPLTGDFSGVAKSSRLYKKGKYVGPVVETMIAGNTFTIAEQILAISDKKELVSGQYYAPHLLVADVTVSS